MYFTEEDFFLIIKLPLIISACWSIGLILLKWWKTVFFSWMTVLILALPPIWNLFFSSSQSNPSIVLSLFGLLFMPWVSVILLCIATLIGWISTLGNKFPSSMPSEKGNPE